MSFKNSIIYILLVSMSFGYAQQSKNKKLFTIDNSSVYSDEFIKVFNKNRDIVSEENKKTIEEYLDLYINYKLKLKQAYELKYDTVSSYKNELAKYREQLISPYLSDGKVTMALVKEAYERTKTEVNASHILLQVSPKASPQDTLKAYQRIIEARNKIIEGASFKEIAKQYSQDPSAQQNGGDLGYFSAFSMVYPFENAAYTTKTGKVSKPFRTRFGYHILTVNSVRDSQGEVQVAHIMLKENLKDSLVAKTKIDELYAQILQGENFERLAKMHSEDRSSSINGGSLPKFNRSRMVPSFAEVAFSLTKPNEVSKPFITPYGWHIVKLIKKHPIQSFEKMESELTEKIEKSPRVAIAGKSIINKLKNTYTIDVDNVMLQSFLNRDTISIFKNPEHKIFTINGVSTPLKELSVLDSPKNNQTLKEVYTSFLDTKVIQYFKDNLENTNQDFAFTMQEYRDGLLLFNILQDKVWKRAEKDTVGLQSFFNTNRENYKWSKRGDVILASCTQKDKALLVKKFLEENKSIDEIKKLVNQGATIHVIFTEGVLEEGHHKLPKDFLFKEIGIAYVVSASKNEFTVIKVKEILPPTLMKLKETRGKVVNDFQEYLEVNWIKELKQKYPVKIKKSVLKKLSKQYQ